MRHSRELSIRFSRQKKRAVALVSSERRSEAIRVPDGLDE